MEEIRIKPENIERYQELNTRIHSVNRQIVHINRELAEFKGQPVSVTLINGRGGFVSQRAEEILNIVLDELVRERTDLITEMNSL